MTEIRNRDGNVIRTSRNLRGILEHARQRIVKVISIDRLPRDKAKLMILWDDGTSLETTFASFSVCVEWISARAWFQGAKLMIAGTECRCNRRHVGYPADAK